MKEPETGRFLFLAKQLCLDFVNTEVMRHGKAVDLLEDLAGVGNWLETAGLLPAEVVREALQRWSGGREDQQLHEAAIELRHQLRRMAEALADRKTVPAGVLEGINLALSRTLGSQEVHRTGGEYQFRRRFELVDPLQLLTPVAETAAALLCSPERHQVRRCENPDCILYFLDTSRNRRRRWCSMEGCGNRAKAAAHYRRLREGK